MLESNKIQEKWSAAVLFVVVVVVCLLNSKGLIGYIIWRMGTTDDS